MMHNKVERDAYIQGTGLNGSPKKSDKPDLDFVKMIQKVDLGASAGIDFQNKPIQHMKDENKIRAFFEQKRKYYKKLQPKKGVFKTEQLPTVSQKGLLSSLTSVKLDDTKKTKEKKK